jgi:polyisoprenoid-binding protein YceI
MYATTAPARLTPGHWTAEPARTEASFAVGHLGKTVRGTIRVTSGALDVGEDGRPVAVRAELDLRTITTGHAKRDVDLHKRGLLDIDAHPAMSFACDDIRTDAMGWRGEGVLGLRGTSCPLSVTGTVDGSAQGALHVVGTATLDRTAIGIRAPRLMIGRLVAITVDAWLTAR